MRIRRGCYDKFHRCPGWVGGGPRYPKDQNVVCSGGSVSDIYDRKFWKWRINRHDKCGTIILPYATRYFDPFWLFYEIKYELHNRWYERRSRRSRRARRRLIDSYRR